MSNQTSARARDYAFAVAIKRAAALTEDPQVVRMVDLFYLALVVRMHEAGCSFEDFRYAVENALPGVAEELTPAATPGALAVERERKAKISWLRKLRFWR